ncbi:hypothetical protein DFH06DRAFT_1486355 [Mycena polygramma]|nr:hypothetical protein DFH06DRAFT_1486355 [Mycena polygramma]
MHRCLIIDELVVEVCSHIEWPSHLYALVRTCTAFREPALDRLWREQNTLRNLIRCLPDDIFAPLCHGLPQGLRRLPETTDWERLLYYSNRVEIFSPGHDSWLRHDVAASLSVALPGGRWFPRLLRLDYNSYLIDVDIRSLVSSRMEYLSFELGTPTTNLLQLSKLCPQLKHFSIEKYRPVDAKDLQQISLSVIQFMRLESLVMNRFTYGGHYWTKISSSRCSTNASVQLRANPCKPVHSSADQMPIECGTVATGIFTPISDASIHHIGLLPTLKSLELGLSPSKLPPSYAVEMPLFINLSSLQLSASHTGSVTSFLQLCRSTTLTKAEFFFPGWQQRSAGELEELTTSLLFFQHSLKCLVLSVHVGRKSKPDLPIARILRHLCDLHHLTSIFISLPAPDGMSDSLVLELVRSWPHVQFLVLCPGVSGATIGALASIAQYCPNLRDLDMTFDASIPASQYLTHPSISQPQLSVLRLHDSAIANPRSVAKFLAQNFPQLRRIDADWNGDWNDDGFYDRWSEVNSYLKKSS